ncbi:MAG: hypothetical protein HRT77_13910 [Halioglobus sp.]|nr:hypothetical protein [Halioglobus sp.]
MKRNLFPTACLLLPLVVACSDHSDTAIDNRESLRDLRYCEIAFFFVAPEGVTSATYNSFELNDCSPADWAALNFKALGDGLGAVVALPNGPRRWLMDVAELGSSEDATRRFFGNLEFRLAANIQLDSPPPPPGIFFFDATVKRDSKLLFLRTGPSASCWRPWVNVTSCNPMYRVSRRT